MSELQYNVPAMTCDHCVNAISTEVGAIPNVTSVQVNLDSKIVTVTGDELDDGAIRSAVSEAGYEVVDDGPSGD